MCGIEFELLDGEEVRRALIEMAQRFTKGAGQAA